MTSNKIFYFFIFLILNACGPARNITYFSNLKDAGETTEKINNKIDAEIQPDDLLGISVSSLNPEANLLFNSGVMQSTGSTSSAAPTSAKANDGYLVDKSGAINFPVLGNVNLAGLTKEQATDKMTLEISKHVKKPIVNIRYLNFRITVIGEVNRPATFTIPTERINILEAIGLAGDMTVYGRRENVLIIREKYGIRTTTRVDMNDKAALNSPYFYLQQNDIVYVEPAKIKTLQGSSSTFYIQLISAGISIISLVAIFLK